MTKFNIYFQSKRLQYVNEYKYLGLMFEHNLKWNNFYKNLLNKLKFFELLSHRLNYTLTNDSKITWYYTYVYSSLSNNILIVYNSSIQYNSKIKKSQQKIIKYLFSNQIKRLYNLKDNKSINEVKILDFMNTN